jgi:Uma2 family endonuclease
LALNPDTVTYYDASVIESSRCAGRKGATCLDGPPLLAVEVMDLDEPDDLVTRLVEESLQHGVRAVWVIDPFEELVIWHQPDRPAKCLKGRMELSADPHLPGFRCSVAEIFE